MKIFVFVLSLICCVVSAKDIRIVGPQSVEDVSQQYFYDLLELALEQNSSEKLNYNLKKMTFETLTHGRTIHLLAADMIDVFWTGTTPEREQQFIPIRIPLLRGLLGYRVSIVKKEHKNALAKMTVSELKQELACQGEHWPDTNILKHNGFSVLAVTRFDLMFKMLNADRCKYFPRALYEGYGELAVAQQSMPELTMLDSTILHYPFAIYFFVNLKNAALAQVIEQGLESAISNGDFHKFMMNHSLTEHLFPLSQWQEKHIITLDNPLLPANTDLTNKRYWITL